jgi:hypothetical protein
MLNSSFWRPRAVGASLTLVAVASGGCTDDQPSASPETSSVDAGAADAGAFEIPHAELAALRSAAELTFWSLDVNGDGSKELIVSNSRKLDEVSGSGRKLLALTPAAAPTAVVLMDDQQGTLNQVLHTASVKWDEAEALWTVKTDELGAQLGALIDSIEGSQCEIANAAFGLGVGALGSAAAISIVGVQAFIGGVLAASLDAATGAAAVAAWNRFDLAQCVNSGQTVQGCIGIGVFEVAGASVDRENLLSSGKHCYDVTAEGDGQTCTPDAPKVNYALCDRGSDTTGCCNRDYVFKHVQLSDIKNQAPLPEVTGVEVTDGLKVRLGAPSSDSPIFHDVVRVLASEGWADFASGPMGCVFRDAFDLLTQSSNPVQVTLGDHCATNTTQDYHILKGEITQCVVEDETSVYGNIRGEGNGRAARFNDMVGPLMLGTVRDELRNAVAKEMERLADEGMCCVGGDVFEADEVGPNCGRGDTDAGTDEMPDAASPSGDGGGYEDAASPSGDAGSGPDAGQAELDAQAPVPSQPDQTGAPRVNYRGTALGDPHLMTLDGVYYNVQPVGEVVLLQSLDQDLEIQVRTKPYGRSQVVAVIDKTALKLGETRVVIAADGTTTIDGVPSDLAEGRNEFEGGDIFRARQTHVLVWPDGSQVRVTVNGVFEGIEVWLPSGRAGNVKGLLGDFDGEVQRDVQTSGGAALPEAPSFTYFYHTFVESWRVTQSNSLFDYAEGESTETFTDRSFPLEPVTSARLSASAREKATAICVDAGVDEDWMEACLIDVGYTDDPAFAEALVRKPRRKGAIEVQPDEAQGGGFFQADDGAAADTLAAGGTNTYPVQLAEGQTVLVRVVDQAHGAFTPVVNLVDSNGAVVAHASAADVAALSYSATTSGPFSVTVEDAAGTAGGEYALYVVIVPTTSEGGNLASGEALSSNLALGDLDSFTFNGIAGENFQLRVTDTDGSSFIPRVDVFGPTGELLSGQTGQDVAAVGLALPMNGTYTVVVSDASSGYLSSGNYDLNFALAPGANEGGLLGSTGMLSDTIDKGDIDSFSIEATAGETVQVRMTDVAGGSLQPLLVVYDPSGAQVTYGYDANVAYVAFQATQSGTYTVLAYDSTSGHAATGDYNLYYAKSPGANEGGLLGSTGMLSDTIDEGDIDSFSIEATAGETVQVRMTDVAGGSLQPLLVVYDPSGVQVTYGYDANVAYVAFQAAQSGTYTVLAYDSTSGHAATGDYHLYYAKSPGANEGGLLGSTGMLSDTIDEGDIDSFTLDASAGETVQVRMTDVAGGSLQPLLVVYDASGAQVTYGYDANVAYVAFQAAQSGTYTVLAYDSTSGHAATGDYNLYYAKSPGANEGGLLIAGAATSDTIDEGDLDSYTLSLSEGQGAHLTMTDTASAGLQPLLVVYDPTGAQVTYGYAADVADVSFTASTTGIYTLLAYDSTSGHAATGDYTLLFELQQN